MSKDEVEQIISQKAGEFRNAEVASAMKSKGDNDDVIVMKRPKGKPYFVDE